MYLITKWFGTFLCDKDGIKNKILFPKNVEEIAKRLLEIDKNNILTEEKKIAKDVKVLVVNEKRLQKMGDYDPDDLFFKKIEIKAEDFGFTTDLLHKASVTLAKDKVEEKLKSEDLQVIQMVNALDDLIQTSNLLSERLDCWSVIPTSPEKIQPLENAFSVINNETKRLEKQIESDMQKVAPNTSKMVGSLIGARLISLAGGMGRLATMPASTIQILGAEKALFRFKKEGGTPPKHGVIFQHPLINKAPRTVRGKIARLLATKIATAAKADVFTKRDLSSEMKEDLEKRMKEIRNL
jgi:nucleolar protein 56